jgi:hypothetical protein
MKLKIFNEKRPKGAGMSITPEEFKQEYDEQMKRSPEEQALILDKAKENYDIFKKIMEGSEEILEKDKKEYKKRMSVIKKLRNRLMKNIKRKREKMKEKKEDRRDDFPELWGRGKPLTEKELFSRKKRVSGVSIMHQPDELMRLDGLRKQFFTKEEFGCLSRKDVDELLDESRKGKKKFLELKKEILQKHKRNARAK